MKAAASHRLAALYVLALFLGLRRGELLGLRWEHVDLDPLMEPDDLHRSWAVIQREAGLEARSP